MAEFDPDAYLAKKSQSVPPPFDPDAYLASKGIKPTREPGPVTKDEIKGLLNPEEGFKKLGYGSKEDQEMGFEQTLKALPIAGSMVGGAVGAPAGPVGMVGGAGLGGAAGESTANAIRSILQMKSAPQSREELYKKPIEAAETGILGEMGGQIAGQAIKGTGGLIKSGLKSTATPVVEGGGQVATKEAAQSGQNMAPSFERGAFELKPKPNASEIQNATQTFGAQPTRGMISSNQELQKIESALSQSPTMAGQAVRGQYEPIYKGLGQAAEDVAPLSPFSKFETGEGVKRGITAKVGEKYAPLSESFNNIRESAKSIQIDPNSANRAATRLSSQDMAEFKNLPQGQAIQKYADMIKGAKTLDSLKQLRSSVGDQMNAAYSAGQGQEAMALGKVKSTIERLERRSILSSAIRNAPTQGEGKAAAQDLIGQIKQTNRGYRDLMGEIENLSSAGNLGKINSPKHLLKVMDEIPSEQIADKMFNTKNYDGLQNIKDFIPEEFEAMRQFKLSEIAKSSMGKNGVDPSKLVRNVEKLGPEARQVLFGPNGDKILNDMKTTLNAIPNKVGPSGTPEGNAWHDYISTLVSPQRWGKEASAAYNYLLLQGRSVPTPAGLLNQAGKSISSPQVLSGLIQNNSKKNSQ